VEIERNEGEELESKMNFVIRIGKIRWKIVGIFRNNYGI
jgi:hypothetical protein